MDNRKKQHKKVPYNELDLNTKNVFDYLYNLSTIERTISNKDVGKSQGDNHIKLENKYNYLKREGIYSDSIMLQYLNPENKINPANTVNNSGEMPLFPFLFNSSQEKAVKIALNNDFSVIQGPPGTGKTQVILNIIMNAILNQKTVLLVSNSNAAVKNVSDKLEKEGFGFLSATLGYEKGDNYFFNSYEKKETKQICNIQEEKIQQRKEKLEEWKNLRVIDKERLKEKLKNLDKYFVATERQARLKMELDALKNEYQNFIKNSYEERKLSKRLSSFNSCRIEKIINKLDYIQENKNGIGSVYKIILKYVYGITDGSYKSITYTSAIETLKTAIYEKEINRLESEINKEEIIINNYESSKDKSLKNLTEESMIYLKKSLSERNNFSSVKIYSKDDFYSKRGEFYDFLKHYPVVFSTTYSARNSVFCGCTYDYLIMDEASQVDIVAGALSLSCAKKAVIVGDEKQLGVIINEKSEKGEDTKSEKEKMDDFYKKFEHCISPGYCYTESFLSSVLKVFNKSNVKIGNTLLREHYRCHPKIINFCNKQFYDNKLIIMTAEDKSDKLDPICIRLNSERIEYNSIRKNQREVDILKSDIFPMLSKEEKKNDKLAVITPYNNQVKLVNVDLKPKDFENGDLELASTVHKYQGQERDNVIISTVDYKKNPFSDDKNLLNVAISRAKKRLFLINSYSEEDRYNSNIGTFIDYAKANNFDVSEEKKVNSIFDFLYSRLNDERLKYSGQKYKISPFKGLSPAEISMYECLKKILKSDEKYKHLDFRFGYSLLDIVAKMGKCYSVFSLEEKRYIENGAHVDFCIFNTVSLRILLGIEVDGTSYHSDEVSEYKRTLKRSIFNKLGIQLEEFKTQGSGEEEAIKKILDGFTISEE